MPIANVNSSEKYLDIIPEPNHLIDPRLFEFANRNKTRLISHRATKTGTWLLAFSLSKKIMSLPCLNTPAKY